MGIITYQNAEESVSMTDIVNLRYCADYAHCAHTQYILQQDSLFMTERMTRDDCNL